LKGYKNMALEGNISNVSFERCIREELGRYFPFDFKFANLVSLGWSYDLWKDVRDKDDVIDDLFRRANEKFSISDKTKTEGTILHARQFREDASLYSLIQGLFTHEKISKNRFRELGFEAERNYDNYVLHGLR